jgi:hypothetical protein
MWMADPHVISALREKRALVAGLIDKLERKLEQHRADLTHIDGVLRLFQPDQDRQRLSQSAPLHGGRGTLLAMSCRDSAWTPSRPQMVRC